MIVFKFISNSIYLVFYGIAWVFWQFGGKQVRRAFAMAYDDIETMDVQRVLQREVDDVDEEEKT